MHFHCLHEWLQKCTPDTFAAIMNIAEGPCKKRWEINFK